MKVLLTATAAVDQRLDGVTVFTDSLARHLLAASVTETALLVSDLRRHPPAAEVEEAEVNGRRVFRVALPVPSTPAEALDPPGCDAIFRKVLEAYRPDVVHFGNLELLSAGMVEVAAQAGVPAIMTLHDFYLICPAVRMLELGSSDLCPGPSKGRRCGICLAATGHLTGRYAGAMRWLTRRLDVWVRRRWAGQLVARFARLKEVVAKLAAVVSPSKFLGEAMIRAGMISEYEHVPNGSEIGPVPRRTGDGLVVGMLAHHTHAKGTSLLVEALRMLPRAPLHVEIHGDGDEWYISGLRHRAGQEKRISFEGPYKQEDLPRILRGLDAVVVPSLFPETLSLAVQDGLAAGRPCIVPTGAGPAETVEHGRHGFHFRRGDFASLARQLELLAHGGDLVANMRALILGDALVPSRAEVAGRYAAIYRRVAGAES